LQIDTLMKAGAEFGATLSARLSVSAVYRLQRIRRDLRGASLCRPVVRLACAGR
jgi:hypothetical protein